MSLLEILRWPDLRLAQRCELVGKIDDAVTTLAADMLETMYAAPGRGLAAPEVGRLIRLFVMDVTWKEGVPSPVVCIDPSIARISNESAAGEEGCLSIPGVTARVVRPVQVQLDWTGLDGIVRTAELDGFAARCAQHEIDHLDGIVTFDRALDRAALEAAYAG